MHNSSVEIVPQQKKAPPLATSSMAAERAPRILTPGRNCWKLAHAARAAFLIDGEAYFSAFRDAAIKASRSIFIVGWDLDSRTTLVPEAPDDGYPTRLGEFLEALVQRQRRLDVYILNWDFTMLYAADRELLPTFKLGWRNHGRLHYFLDAAHPMGASQHQKIVVIDDAVAFVGGLDLCENRWDTPAHCHDEPRRRNHKGTAYVPFHDVQLMVDGDAAAALGVLARERWRRAKDSEPHIQHQSARTDPWPSSVTPDMIDVDVAIARTEPSYKTYPPVQEVKQQYLDAIAAAQDSIYIENQYLTAHAVTEAIENSLQIEDGPEIVLVSRLGGGGWLERNTMTVLRARALKRLRAADVYGRLRIYCPDNSALRNQCIDLHSKLMIVDDWLVRVGSANLNNRSMGLDTECDLTIEASDARTAAAIVRFRNRLLAEHLSVEPETVAHTLEQKQGSLIATIEALQGNTRTLKPLLDDIAPEMNALIPEAAVIDPEQPIDPDRLMDEFIPVETHASARKRVYIFVGALIAIAALAAAWAWSPLAEWISPEAIARAAAALEGSPMAPIWVLGAFLIASCTAIPITVLIVATVLIFGPMVGFGYALTGSLLGAALTFALGQRLGRGAIRRLAGGRINKLSRRLGKRGLLAILAVRIIPVAPFTIVNLVAGASQIGWRDFLLGTLFGMAPGMLAITVFADRLAATLRDPSPTSLAMLAIALVLIVACALVVRSWLKRHGDAQPSSA